MAKLCPFKKETITIIEYGFTSVRENPKQIKKDEHFGICDGLNCMAYDGGICKMIESAAAR